MITLTVSGILALPFLLVGGIVAWLKKGRRLRVFKWTGVAYIISLSAFLFGVAPYLMAGFLANAGSRPMDQKLTETPSNWQLPFEEIEFAAADGILLRGWFIAPRGKDVVITYSHGLFRNRHEMLERAVKLCQLGYGALLYDSRHHGQSKKGIVSLGYFERNDVLGAIRWLLRRPQTTHSKIVLMGVSMGATAVLMAAAETADYSAIIADSPFLDFEKTIAHHAWLFLKMPKYPFVPIFLHFYRQRANLDGSQFDVLAAASKTKKCPVLMIHGGSDERIPVADGQRIFEALPTPQKEFFVVEGATHGAGYRMAPDVYMARLTQFLSQSVE